MNGIVVISGENGVNATEFLELARSQDVYGTYIKAFRNNQILVEYNSRRVYPDGRAVDCPTRIRAHILAQKIAL